MGLLTRVEPWVTWTEDQVRSIHATASAAPLGGDDAWRALLGTLGVEPLSDDERVRMLEGAPTSRGAFPVEVRRALEAVAGRSRETARQFEAALFDIEDPSAEEALERWQRRIESLVEQELPRYLTAVRPAPTTGSIFANALATSRPHLAPDSAQGPGIQTHTCPTCGAPRMGDNQGAACDYCGSPIL